MEWRTFIETYAPDAIRVESLRATKLTAGRKSYELAITGLRDGMSTRVSITSMGAASAMTQILADHGADVIKIEPRQVRCDDFHTAIFDCHWLFDKIHQ